MSLYLYHHPACEAHDPGPGHSERAERLTAILARIKQEVPDLRWIEMPRGQSEDIARVHTQDYIDFVVRSVPQEGYREIEINDVASEDDGGEVTTLCPQSGEAVWHAVGGAVAAVDAVMAGKTKRAFCACRPPGHHALAHKAMGFCVFNTVAIAARHALEKYGLGKVAIVDFDVHHGNGTQAIFESEPRVFFASIHQLPLWPETGREDEQGVGNILNVPVAPDTPREAWLHIWRDKVLARLEEEKPELILISAGFDAHKDDPKGSQNLETEDYATLAQDLVACANRYGSGRVISVLEGGYDIEASAASAAAHVKALAEG